jgi:dienelactone hydrolase
MLKRVGKILTAVAIMIAAAPLALTAEVAWEAHRPIALPRPSGPYAVGRSLMSWPRPDARGNSPQSQAMFLWYPAALQGGRRAAYLPQAWARAAGMIGPNIRLQDWAKIDGWSQEDAPAAARSGGFPVVILTPGYTALPTDYTILAEELASRGYVVVGLTPGCCARVSVDPDGRVSTPSRGRPLSDADRGQVAALAASEVVETRAALMRLAVVNTQLGGAMAGRLDLSRLALVGHSLGGSASLQACAIETRCRAVVDLDGEPAGPVVRTGLAKPVLILRRDRRMGSWFIRALTGETQGEQAMVLAGADRDDAFLVRRGSPGSQVVELAGAGHGDFTDMAVLSPTLGRVLGLLGMASGQVGLKGAVDRVAVFLDAHV